MEKHKPVTSAQLRAARGLAGLSRPELAELTGVSVRTILTAETDDEHRMRKSAEKIIRAVFEAKGIELIEGGARLRPKQEGKTSGQGGPQS